MNRQERRGQIIFVVVFGLLAIDQIATVITAVSKGFGNVSMIRNFVVPGLGLYWIYYFWRGGDDSRKSIAWILVGFGLIYSCISGWILFKFATGDPIGRAAMGAVVGVSIVIYRVFADLVWLVAGLMVLFAPSVIAFLDYQRYGSSENVPTPEQIPAPPIDRLPQWARVAYAARCARLVTPLLREHWPSIPENQFEAVRRAVDLAEHSAANGASHPDVKHAEMHAILVAASVMSGEYLSPESEAPPNLHSGVFAGWAARAAAQAALSARCVGIESSNAANEAWSSALAAAEGNDAITKKIAGDFQRLSEAAHRGQWNEVTKVPPEIWNSL
jgi:hypothetical protein